MSIRREMGDPSNTDVGYYRVQINLITYHCHWEVGGLDLDRVWDGEQKKQEEIFAGVFSTTHEYNLHTYSVLHPNVL